MPTYHTLIVARTMQPSESPRNIVRASTIVSCSHAFEEGALQIQIALSKEGGWWEGGNTSSVESTPHNGVTRHNINKARVQATILLTQRHTGRGPCPPRFLLISFPVPIYSFTCSVFHLHTYTMTQCSAGRLGICIAHLIFQLNLI